MLHGCMQCWAQSLVHTIRKQKQSPGGKSKNCERIKNSWNVSQTKQSLRRTTAKMANFRRRSRFRRELIEKQPQESLTFTSLGSRLASFKYQPDPDLECKYRLENTKPIFIGACTKCTLHSASTFLKESLSNFAQMQNSLEEEGDEGRTEPSKASLPLAEIDFRQEISNHRYVRCGNVYIFKQIFPVHSPSSLC